MRQAGKRRRSLIPVRRRPSETGRRRFERVSGAQLGSAVRSAGDLLEAAPTAPVKHYLFEGALVQDGLFWLECEDPDVTNLVQSSNSSERAGI
jgi:hypothetical protein